MFENIKKYLSAMRERIGRLPSSKKWAGLGMAVAILAVGAALAHVWSRDPHVILYSDLQPEESRSITKKLGEFNIPYQVQDDNGTVTVPGTQVAVARMQLAKAGLPGQDVVGFEKFDNSTLGMSSYVQRIQYVRAVQGELTRSIQRLAAVKRARVHISVPPKKTFLEEEDPPKASVVLELRNGQSPSKSEVAGIAHLVASAVEGLKVSHVTIVDTKGNFLHRPEDVASTAIPTALLEMQRNIESEYEKRIEEILTPVVGLGKVRAKVTAEVDPSRINTTEESYDPDKAVVKSSIKNDETFAGSRPNPVGVPGSRSNLPGTEPNNPGVPVATNSTEKNMQNTQYAIPRKIQIVDKPSGSIKRLTVAVVVDGTYAAAPSGKGEIYSPRGEEELNRIKDLVANAVGIDGERRDSVTVNSMPFHTADLPSVGDFEGVAWWKGEDFHRQLLWVGLYGVLLALFGLMIVRPFLRWAGSSASEPEFATLPKTVAQLEAERKEEALLALGKGGTHFIQDIEPLEKKEEQELRKKILDRMTETPRKGLRIVQDWLEEENPKVNEIAEAA